METKVYVLKFGYIAGVFSNRRKAEKYAECVVKELYVKKDFRWKRHLNGCWTLELDGWDDNPYAIITPYVLR